MLCKHRASATPSCRFDVETLKPTYRLLIGIPSKSTFAINVVGTAEEIIEAAETQYLCGEKTRFEDVLSQLDQTRQELERGEGKRSTACVQSSWNPREIEQFPSKRPTNRWTASCKTHRKKKQTVSFSSVSRVGKVLQELDDIRHGRKARNFQASARCKISYRSNINRLEDTFQPGHRLGAGKVPTPLRVRLKKGDLVLITFNEKASCFPADNTDIASASGLIKTKGAGERPAADG